ncbi:hypothetical protein AB1L88_15230 [Tautonia sp. JC769]|uniref:hypothetical protein n=1 Tax=Tautonia sp. JC769 TaxID=3232135 RepID=UPI003458AB6F
MAIRVILRDGVFYPIDPIPPEWPEGIEAEVGEPGTASTQDEFENWVHEIEAIARENGLDDLSPLTAALNDTDREAKELMKREMGIPQ